MSTKLDDRKLDALSGEIVDCLSGLLDRQMKALDPQHRFDGHKFGDARKGLTSAYISFAEAQCASVGWGNAMKAITHTEAAHQKLRAMLEKLENQTG